MIIDLWLKGYKLMIQILNSISKKFWVFDGGAEEEEGVLVRCARRYLVQDLTDDRVRVGSVSDDRVRRVWGHLPSLCASTKHDIGRATHLQLAPDGRETISKGRSQIIKMEI